LDFKKIVSLILVIALAFCLFGCNKNDNEEQTTATEHSIIEHKSKKEEKPEYGGELIVPLTTIKTLNPLLSENISLYYFNKLIFESLFELDEQLNIKNVLAEDYSIEDEGRVISIRLRDNVFWHDGEKFTADDVRFTVDTIKYGNAQSIYKEMLDSGLKASNFSDWRHILKVNVIDDLNLQIVFDRNYSNGLETLTFPIIPKHVFVEGREGRSSYQRALEYENYIPVGTGPYKYEDYEKLKRIQLVANDKWWSNRPYIDRIVGIIFEDEELLLTAFETGQIDLTTTLGIDWEKYSQNKRVKIYEFISPNYEFLAFNFNNNLMNDEKGLALRKAIQYGIDRQEIIQKVYLGHATQIDVPIYPNSWLVCENSNVYGYDINTAKKILQEAGWIDRDGDGICEDENGEKLSIRLLTNSYNVLRLKTANMIADQLRKIGIEVVKEYNEDIPENLTEEMINAEWEVVTNKVEKGNYDVALLGWQLSTIPDLSFAFHSSQIRSGTNFIRYKNEEMDEMLVDAFNASTREEKREKYDRLQNMIVEELPYVSLFFKNRAVLIDNKVHGDINPQYFNIYYNIDNWYIPKEYQQDKK
jgi:peptide/nickel transport system substrate-binding protein